MTVHFLFLEVSDNQQVGLLMASAAASFLNNINSWDALKTIMRTEGLSGIYKGYAATLGLFGPFSALYFVFYERFKYWTRLHVTGDVNNDAIKTMRDVENVEIPFSWLLLCSSSAGAAASWRTSPLDTAKLRLQVQRGLAAAGGDSISSSQLLARSTYKGV